MEGISDQHIVRDDRSIIVFDDTCLLCSGLVRWIIHHDRYGQFWFIGQPTALKYKIISHEINSVVLVKENQRWTKGRAVIEILNNLDRPWSFFGWALKLLPVGILDLFYDIVASVRHKLFKNLTNCQLDCTIIRQRLIE